MHARAIWSERAQFAYTFKHVFPQFGSYGGKIKPHHTGITHFRSLTQGNSENKGRVPKHDINVTFIYIYIVNVGVRSSKM